MKVVEGEFVLNEHQDQDAARHPDGQAGYVDEGVAFGFPKVPQGDLEIVFEHQLFPPSALAARVD